MLKSVIVLVCLWWIELETCTGLSSPIQPVTSYKHSIELQANIADLWWTVDDAERHITFELHIQSTGWIALGISPGKTFSSKVHVANVRISHAAGGMKGADIAVGWVESSGKVHLQVSG